MGVVSPRTFQNKDGLEFVVRSAKAKDAASVRILAKGIMCEMEFGITEPDEYTVTDDEELAFIEKLNTSETGLALVAECEGKVIGFMDFQPKSNRRRLNHVHEFGMCVEKEYRELGIGRRLLEVMLEFARQNTGIKKVALSVLANNERAIHLYKSLGFQEEGRLVRAIKIANETYVDDIRMYIWVK